MPDGTISIKNHPLFLHYYGDHRACNIKNDDWKTSLIIWNNLANMSRLPKTIRIDFEEMLTICGLHACAFGYVPGDELSENLYRAECGMPLRFGHRVITFVENEGIFHRVYDCAGYFLNLLKINKQPVVGNERLNEYTENSSAILSEAKNCRSGVNSMFFYTIPDDKLDNFKLLIPDRGMYVGVIKPIR